MRSPFPGMDPFLESQKWEDFHTSFIAACREALVPSVRPRYVVEVERRIYLETADSETPYQSFVADVAVRQHEAPHAIGAASDSEGLADAGATGVQPLPCTLAFPEERREAFITIRRGAARDIVTVIELLSPTNKRSGTDGRRLYLDKMREVLQTNVHFVELDLLRGGVRTPLSDRPAGDYYALVSRAARRPAGDIYGWPLEHALPPIPIPLAGKDPDVTLDLQSAFDSVYQRAGYDYAVDYRRPVEPSLSPPQQRWVASRLHPNAL